MAVCFPPRAPLWPRRRPRPACLGCGRLLGPRDPGGGTGGGGARGRGAAVRGVFTCNLVPFVVFKEVFGRASLKLGSEV